MRDPLLIRIDKQTRPLRHQVLFKGSSFYYLHNITTTTSDSIFFQHSHAKKIAFISCCEASKTIHHVRKAGLIDYVGFDDLNTRSSSAYYFRESVAGIAFSPATRGGTTCGMKDHLCALNTCRHAS